MSGVEDLSEWWGAVSPNGAPIPPAPPGLSERDATSPARRSPQVRAAQALGIRRPDLLPLVNALEV